jgi:hypothetical protein
VLLYFSVTLFTSALLLFLVEPMVAKMILPLLGGTPSVWNTCMAFFQATLLAGYLYAHLTSKWLSVRRQFVLHAVVLLVPFLTLPIDLGAWGTPPGDASPIPWLLAILACTVGPAFFVVSASAPILQRWFASTGHPAARDPYFLYAASNAGSLIALLAYPLLVEPRYRLDEQSWMWGLGYGLLGMLIGGCAISLWNSRLPDGPSLDSLELTERVPTTIAWGRRLRWIALATVPSSLLLGFTTYLTTDIAAIPLLWVVPLAFYLLTFVLVFARRPPLPHAWMARLLPFVVLPSLVLLLAHARGPSWLVLPIHFLAFFVTAMVCHGELAEDRPAPVHLTEFYLLMSVGGVIGGLFNALVAPLMFSSVAEYPLALVLGCLLLPWSAAQRSKRAIDWADIALPISFALAGGGLLLAAREYWPNIGSDTDAGSVPLKAVLGLLAMLSFPFAARPLRFGLCVGAFTLVGMSSPLLVDRVIHIERSFFGVHRVVTDAEGEFHLLVHGNTTHGVQSLDPAQRREPLAYYTRRGPLGQIFAALDQRRQELSEPAPHIAVIGLGCGAITAYLEPGQRLTCYEIDPSVVRIARNPDYFTFLSDTKGKVDIVLGDGRLTLASAPANEYGLIVVDAFSSDAIPLHLVTRQALALYASKLAEHGVIGFHISNRYLDLEPVLGDLAADAGLVCRAQKQLPEELTEDQVRGRQMPSHWVVMARSAADLGSLASDGRWHAVEPRPNARIWTDDYSNILSVLKKFF